MAGILCVYLALAAVYTHPVLQHSHDRIANDPYDPILNTSILWWNATTVPFTDRWWSPPHFYPAKDVAAFTENLVGVSVLASPVFWLTGNALAAYNLSFFLTWPLSAFAAYLLAFVLTRRHDAAFLAGLSFGFTPYRTAELGHIQMLSVYWIPLCLVALHRFLETRRGGWLILFAAAWILQALANGYFIFFGAVLIGLWIVYYCSTRDTWRAVPAIAVTCVLANLALVPVLLKYHAVHQQYGLRRVLSEVQWFSAPASAWFEVSSVVWFWSRLLPDSKDNLFPGVTAVFIVLVALWRSRWLKPSLHAPSPTFRRVIAGLALLTALSVASIVATLVIGPWRIEALGLTLRTSGLDRALRVAVLCGTPLILLKTRLAEVVTRRDHLVFYIGATIALGVLCCGPALRVKDAIILDPMPYRWLMAVPGFDQLRVPTRFWMLGTLCLGVAAALAFARLVPPRGRLHASAVLLLSAGLMLDGWTRGITMAAAPQQWPRVERRDRSQPILELPLGPDWDAAATFRSMRHRRPVLNGVSGYDPPHYEPLKAGLSAHDPELLLAIASLGSFDVVVNSEADPDGAWGRYAASIPGVAVTATDGTRTVYRLPVTTRPEVRLGPALPIVSAWANSQDGSLAVDGRMETEWHDGRSQQPGQWLIADLGEVREVAGVTHALGEYARDFPRRLAIDVSLDGLGWVPAWQGRTVVDAFLAAIQAPIAAPLRFAFEPRQARFIRLRQLDTEIHLWRIAELQVHGRADGR
jgi:F5/8 type C domain